MGVGGVLGVHFTSPGSAVFQQVFQQVYGTATGKNKVRRYTKVEGTTVTTVVQTLYSVLYRSLKLLGSLTKGCCYSYKYKS